MPSKRKVTKKKQWSSDNKPPKDNGIGCSASYVWLEDRTELTEPISIDGRNFNLRIRNDCGEEWAIPLYAVEQVMKDQYLVRAATSEIGSLIDNLGSDICEEAKEYLLESDSIEDAYYDCKDPDWIIDALYRISDSKKTSKADKDKIIKILGVIQCVTENIDEYTADCIRSIIDRIGGKDFAKKLINRLSK